jgi:hypothetical protein
MVDPFASPEPLHDPRQLIGVVGWDKEGNGFPPGLLSRVTEKPLRTPVPAPDHTIQGVANDGVVGGLHDSRKLEAGP